MEIFSMKKPFSVILFVLLLSAAALADVKDEAVVLNTMMQKCGETYHIITNILFPDTRDMTFEEIQEFFREAPDHRHYVYGWKSYRWAEYEEALGVFDSCISFENVCKNYLKSKDIIIAQTPQLAASAPSPSPPFFF
ncbi:hypothetical protein M9H77_20554 [Catharanthus roseus]|uniref:Uncharacterized protein n=1 Tax=Catharanthus roseus TaxID=4058 RepID=A0ACC0AP24_CATRO|nr:hypothetical protein M9H77_20554 [Catharanthus roseus]